MAIVYEWCLETLGDAIDDSDDDFEILDTDHRDTLAEFQPIDIEEALQDTAQLRLVLVREVHHDAEGLQDRSWAYVKGGKLPERFTYCPKRGMPVPLRFVRELARFTK